MSAKRPAENDICETKRKKLALSSPEKSSESDSESIHSCQGYKTELADDTNNTSSSSFIPPFVNEYEVAEPEKEKLRFYLSDDSLEQDYPPEKVIKVTDIDNLDNGLLGDTSEENSTSPTSNSDVDPGLPRNDYLDFEKCLLCRTEEKDISYPYCDTCFAWKRNFFPDPPRRRKKSSKKSETLSDALSKDDSNLELPNNKSEKNYSETDNKSRKSQELLDDSGMGSADATQSEDVVDGPSTSSSGSSWVSTSTSTSTLTPVPTSDAKKSDICSVCFSNPENGLFVHLKTAHRYGCYSCAKEIWHQNGGCPLCRRRVYKVSKLYL